MGRRNTNPTAPAIDDKPLVDENISKGEDSDFDEGEGDEDEDEDDAAKAEVALDDLKKGLDVLDATAKALAAGASPREAQLSAKIASGETLTKSEREEYASLLKGDAAEPTGALDDLHKSLDNTGAFDASDFLEALVTKIGAHLDSQGSTIRKSQESTDAFNAQLGGAFVQMGRAIATMSKAVTKLDARLDTLMKAVDADLDQPQPARGSTRPSAPPAPKGGKQLSKGEVLDVMEEMMRKGEFPEGFEPLTAISKYETTTILDKPVADAIARRMKPAA
jgi:hypothetical protein